MSAICLGFYGISFFASRPANHWGFYLVAMLLWIAAALMVLKRPKSFGLPVALLAFGSVTLQFYFLRTHLADIVSGSDLSVSPKLWVNFWFSVMPLVLGGVLAIVAFYVSRRQRQNLTEGEQAEAGRPLTAR